jgi:hypothetical protein
MRRRPMRACPFRTPSRCLYDRAGFEGSMRRLLRNLFERVGRGQSEAIAVRFADGSSWQNRAGDPAVTVVFRTAAAEARTLLLGYVGFFEAYFDQHIDILGEDAVGRLMRLAYGSAYRYQANPIVTLLRRWREWRDDNHDAAAAQANARRHYGLPHPFFRLMLGEDCLSTPEASGTRARRRSRRRSGIAARRSAARSSSSPASVWSRSAPAGARWRCMRPSVTASKW